MGLDLEVDTKTGARKLAALDDLISIGRIAPELVGKVEYIGEAIRNVDERAHARPEEYGHSAGLRHSVVPVLNAPTLAVERVLMIRHVAGCVDVRLRAGAKIISQIRSNRVVPSRNYSTWGEAEGRDQFVGWA